MALYFYFKKSVLLFIVVLIFVFFKFENLNLNKVLTPKFESPNKFSINYSHYYIFNDKFVKRPGSYPLVTGDTFRIFSDYIFEPNFNSIPSNFLIKNNSKIFVKTDFLDHFFNEYFYKFNKFLIIISHNSDLPITSKYKKYLDDDRLSTWFAQNVEFNHSKLIPIPIGFQNAHWSKNYTTSILRQVDKPLKPWNQREILLYINFNFRTNSQARLKYLARFQKLKGVHILKNKIDFATYLTDLNNSKFVLCPRGNGLDTHRVYETILMGAIPIIHSSMLDKIFENSTVLIVSSFEQISAELLHNVHNYIKNMNFPKNVIFLDTWIKKIDQAA